MSGKSLGKFSNKEINFGFIYFLIKEYCNEEEEEQERGAKLDETSRTHKIPIDLITCETTEL